MSCCIDHPTLQHIGFFQNHKTLSLFANYQCILCGKYYYCRGNTVKEIKNYRKTKRIIIPDKYKLRYQEYHHDD